MFRDNLEATAGKIVEFIDTCVKDTFVIVGGLKSGKSCILNLIQNKLNKEPYSTVCLSKSFDMSIHLEYGVFSMALATNSKNSIAKKGIIRTIAIISESASKLADFATSLDEYMLNYSLFSFNSTELEIIKRLYSYASNERLVVLADDIDKWDNESFHLLQKLVVLKSAANFTFFNKMVFICTQSKDEVIINIQDKYIYIEKVEFLEFFNLISNSPLKDLSEEAQRQIYNITDGNYGLIEDIIDFTMDIQTKETETSIFQQSRFEEIFRSIIAKRLEIIDTQDLNIMLENASLVGEVFDPKLLIYLLNSKEYEIKKLLYIAKNQHFIYEINDMWKYSADYVYDYFLESVNDRAPEVQYKMAEIFKKYLPSDIYSRYKHLKGAGLDRRSLNALTIFCIRKILEGKYYKIKYEEAIKQLPENYDILSTIKSINFTSDKKSDYIKAKALLASAEDFLDEVVLIEKEYVQALVLYRCDNIEDTIESQYILEEIVNNENIDIYQWAKAVLLLIIIYTNRLSEYSKAKKVEKKLVLKLSKYEKLDKGLKTISCTIQRISPALYNTDIAYLKLKKSYTYFENNKDIYPKDYIMAATNFMAVCICNSQYDMAVEIGARTSNYLLEHFTIQFPQIFKFFNNEIIAKLLLKLLSLEECLHEYDILFEMKPEYKNQRLLKNNYGVIHAYLKIDTAFSIINELYWNNKKFVHNDYYTYLFGNNLLVVFILKNEYANARRLFLELNNLIPTICKNDASFIQKRYHALEKIICSEKTFANISILESTFMHLVNLDDYWNRLLILSDCQYWTEL